MESWTHFGGTRESTTLVSGFHYSESRIREPPGFLHKGRFASVNVCSVEEFILEQENRNAAQNLERAVRLLEIFLKTKDENRKIEVIPAVDLNENIRQFIISVRTKDGNEYQWTSIRSLGVSSDSQNTGKQSMEVKLLFKVVIFH